MKTKRIKSYGAFKRDGMNYYPRIEQGRLILPSFSINADKGGNHHRRTLVCTSNVLYNRGQFAAVQYLWISLYGQRSRWFYFRGERRVTFNQLTWDERRMIAYQWSRVGYDKFGPEDWFPPFKRWRDYCYDTEWVYRWK